MTNCFLKTDKTRIVNSRGESVALQGVNLGGWLMMEAYILHAPNYAEQRFKRNFARVLGERALQEFESEFRKRFIQKSDFQRLAHWGFNCVRVPFHYRLIESHPYVYDRRGVRYLDAVVEWGREYGIWIILDLHAACGAQNHDWHSDSLGKAELWKSSAAQRRTIALWEFLADRYKDRGQIAGYDLLNEAVIEDAALLNKFYRTLVKAIRRIDKNHILFIEGSQWATDIGCLADFDDANYALSIHCYNPLEFTFNFVPGLSYPVKSKTLHWNKTIMARHLRQYRRIAEKRSVPIFLGEFGVNVRDGFYGEDQWLCDILQCCRELEFHWTYWTYKAVKSHVFPDGVLSYRDNPPWVNRQGPLTGWDTYPLYWDRRKNEIAQSWQTEAFQENTRILDALRKAVKENVKESAYKFNQSQGQKDFSPAQA